MNAWKKGFDMAFDEVAENNPVTENTPTRINSEGKVVNMSRKAMLERVDAMDTVFFGVITGEIKDD